MAVMTAFGVTSMVAPLRWVAVRRPTVDADYASAHWAQPLDVDLLLDQHATFVGLLERLGCEILELAALPQHADACFVYDPAFVTGAGVVRLRAAKGVRVGEAEPLTSEIRAAGLPLVGALEAPATADGGDMFWLDDATLAVGRSYRTNAAAVDQLRTLLPDVRIETFDLPHAQGPQWCLHLMSVVSPVREDLAVVYERLAPVPLVQQLQSRGIEILPLPKEDWSSLGCNVLAVSPGVVVIASGNDATAEALAARGCEVHVYPASEISKGEGGPTCLTRPLHRAY